MNRVLPTLALALLCAPLPAFAADYPTLKPAYAQDWQDSAENPLRFEGGLRYWYSRGEQYSEVGSGTEYDTTDTSHIIEAHYRIDDDYTSTFLKGQAGYAAVINGEHVSGNNAPDSFEGGHIGYVGSDFGWTPFGNEQFRLGGLLGYQYNRESPDRNRWNVEDVDGLNIHSLRLGVTSHADMGLVDMDAEAAFVPYAYAYGNTTPIPFADDQVGGITVNRRSTEATGALYGASGQVMFGIHPTENLTIRVGARAWYLTGPSSARERFWEASSPDEYIYSNQALSGFNLFRYGGLAEITGRF
jgi:hypothetical protein